LCSAAVAAGGRAPPRRWAPPRCFS